RLPHPRSRAPRELLSFPTRRSSDLYITLFVDLDERRLLYATEGRKAATLGLFRQDLEQHGGGADRIEDFCLDMSAANLKGIATRSEEHTSELQSRENLACRLLLEKK